MYVYMYIYVYIYIYIHARAHTHTHTQQQRADITRGISQRLCGEHGIEKSNHCETGEYKQISYCDVERDYQSKHQRRSRGLASAQTCRTLKRPSISTKASQA